MHLGSLLAALGSYLDARAHGGTWLVRIEDVDRGREVPGAADDILRSLEAHGLLWDGPVLRQSRREEAYAEALARLVEAGLAYPCSCSRAELEGPPGRYPGTCRDGPRRREGPFAMRLRTAGFGPVTVADRLQPPYTEDVEAVVGDFVLRRRDGYYAYQLAVVVDDAFQGITDVVRGLDLLDNTPRQRLLQAALGLPAPRVLHLPLLVEPSGGKLSKSRQALPLDPRAAPASLTRVLGLLQLALPQTLQQAPVGEQLSWAVAAWNVQGIQGFTEIIVTP
ncbi:MAG: tRNA glutamyl-Q(34) synthetase GluQRS [Proteobacteria bacterium]|nr:tRNA glutamyl-Q(34) synthetase GluQRS [Pseudomonadota bacterium]